MRRLASCSDTFWWMREPAKRVSAASLRQVEGLRLAAHHAQCQVQHLLGRGSPAGMRGYHWPTPTWTFRKRAGAAPWPTRCVCIGSPLPQFGTPHSRHSASPQMASQLPQNSGVMPV